MEDEGVQKFVASYNELLAAVVRRQHELRRTRFQPRQLYDMLERCLTRHPDGRIYGFRGLIRYKHIVKYERTKPVAIRSKEGQGGAAGAFSQLLARYPELERFLRREARRRHQPITSVREVRRNIRRIHKPG